MSKTLVQKLVFKNTTSKVLYELYMNEKMHSTVTDSPAKIVNKVGVNFTAYNGYIVGKNLQLIKDKLIVQSWRGNDWSKEEMDSVFILAFSEKGNDVILNVVHTNVPKKHFDSIKKSWDKFYWKPWKKYIESKPIAKDAVKTKVAVKSAMTATKKKVKIENAK